MKKYRRTHHFFKHRKLKWMLFILFLILPVFLYPHVFSFFSLCIAISFAFWLWTEQSLVSQKQACGRDTILVYKGKKCIEQINYSRIACLVIVNAALGCPDYMVGYIGATPLVEKKVHNAETENITQLAYLGVYQSSEILQYFKPKISSYQLSTFPHERGRFYDEKGLVYGDDSWLYGSICWLDYLEELLTHVQTAPIYILEDVYARFQPDYDRIFSKAKNPIYIITAPQTCRQYLRKNVI